MNRSDDAGGADDRKEALGDAIPDGGTMGSPFEVVAEYEETRGDRYRKLVDTYVRAPIAIIWYDWRARFGFVIVLFYVLMGLVGPHVVEPTNPTDGPIYVAPFTDWNHPLGTDRMGRDLLSQTVHSTTPLLKMITAGGLFTVGVGTVVGAIAGYKGGWADTILSSITDVFINIPGLPLVMVLAILLEDYVLGNPWLMGILLSVAAWGGLARAIRSQMLTLRNEPFTEASRAMGISTPDIVFKDIVPHLMPYVVINLTNSARRVIFEAVALYYLGILPFEDLNWGITLSLAYESDAFIRPRAFHWFLVPMVAIVIISIGLILLGQSLDRVFNPRVRARHEKQSPSEEGDVGGEDEANTTVMGGGV